MGKEEEKRNYKGDGERVRKENSEEGKKNEGKEEKVERR